MKRGGNIAAYWAGRKGSEYRPPSSARDLEIARRYSEGETLSELGAAFALSRERIRQIVADHRVASAERVE